jgi:hypothetical protein
VIIGANLYGASFEAATFGGTTFDCDLSQVTGLESTSHGSPSYINMRTLNMLRPPIPTAFLRGCGLADWEIALTRLYERDLTTRKLTEALYEVNRLRTDSPIQYYSVFISYSHADERFATRLYSELQRRRIRCWFDRHSMLPGDDIYEQVDRAIRLWDKMLLCCSRDSMTSWWVDNEIDSAFEKERQLMKQRGEKTLALIPLDLDGFILSSNFRSGKKQQVLSRLAADFNGWEADATKFTIQLEGLIRALHLADMGREMPPPSRL